MSTIKNMKTSHRTDNSLFKFSCELNYLINVYTKPTNHQIGFAYTSKRMHNIAFQSF